VFSNPATTDLVVTIAAWAEPWRRTFSHSAVVSTLVLFLHVASLVYAGGLSLTADRAVLAPQGDTGVSTSYTRQRCLAARALIAVFVSGLLLFLSDIRVFVELWTFWLKMTLVTMLVINALVLRRFELAGAIARSRVYAKVSVGLWMLTLLAGTAIVSG
jgi:hypothetical protein